MVIGHTKIIERLEVMRGNNTLAHGYLFYGPRSVGKFKTALELARTLICSRGEKSFGGCGDCETCSAFDAGTTSNLTILRPGKPILESEEKDKKEIGIAEIREVRRRLAFASSGYRVVIIDGAEKLTGEAANAFLKILEEPGPQTLFIFVSESPEYILPTILSRLAPIRFSLVPDEEMRKVKGATEKLITLAAGAPGISISAVNDPEFRKAEEGSFSEAEKIYGGSLAKAISAGERWVGSREKYSRILLHLLRFSERDLLLGDEKEKMTRVGRLENVLDILRLYETTNVNPRLAADILFINLRSVKIA
ncbi:MAG: hypothetical protein HYT39_02345 [Candidatus Sungbacteria bacterium]|nr:hypothetical protein [Candidatus Sungbacteria bacterium]